MALHINRRAVKLRCAGEWVGWGWLSVDGPGHYNPDRSEGPWGRTTQVVRMAVLNNAGSLRHRTVTISLPRTARGMEANLRRVMGMPGAGLTGLRSEKAPSEMPALEPYWGKPAVRNLREDNGNVGIIRSPVRAIVLPDSGLATRLGGWSVSGRRGAEADDGRAGEVRLRQSSEEADERR